MTQSTISTHAGSPRAVRLVLWGALALVLAIPLVAMLFTDSVAWGPGDFLVAALILGGAGLMVELGLRALPTMRQRIVLGVVVAAGVALLWAELAVGIFS